MYNILLVFTGGTIGSSSIDGTINISKQQSYKLLEMFTQLDAGNKTINFNVIQATQILSENLFPTFWETLINTIEAENPNQYDGIIITHGTDTLAFSASALGLYFNELEIPLLLVSSDYPLEDPRANGLKNFTCAIQFIKQRKEKGVFVPYTNNCTETMLHHGTRLASCLQLSGDFISVQSKAYLKFQNNQFELQHANNSNTLVTCQLKPLFSTKILLVKPYPGLDYSSLALDNVEVVLHDLYHSGSACSTDEWGNNHSLVSFIKKCKRWNIPFYMAPAIQHINVYQSTKQLFKHDAKMIWNMSLESAYTKLLLGYGNFSDESLIEEFLQQNIAGEIIA